MADNSSSWFSSIVRIAGASFPVSSSLVQLQSELDASAMASRIDRLEDPVSYLHEDIQAASKEIYSVLKDVNSERLTFDSEFYDKYRRPIVALESEGFITVDRLIGWRHPHSICLSDPTFTLYMCQLAENSVNMQEATERVDLCEVGITIDGSLLAESLSLPIIVVQALFSVYENRGYGITSKTVGHCSYLGTA